MTAVEGVINVIFPANWFSASAANCRQILPRMDYLRLQNRVRKVCAVVAAALILPALAYADGNDQGQNNNNQGGSVPDGGPGIVLLFTTFGAMLLFSARRPSRAKD